MVVNASARVALYHGPSSADSVMDKGRRFLWILVGVLAIALVGVALFKAWPLLYPEVARVVPLDPSCDLRQGPCVSPMPGSGAISFGIEPLTLPAAQPLRLGVVAEGVAAEEVAVDFSGVDMNMGFNRVLLQQVQPGRFEGRGMLPVCVRNRMTWEARVLMRTSEGLIAVPYRFETHGPGE
jgi:hypothetical protein